MVTALERLGVRMLARVLPAATAQAAVCSCDPGYCWCQNRYTKNYCCCNSNCTSTTCWCNPNGCR